MLFDSLEGLRLEFFLIDHTRCFLVGQLLECFTDAKFARLFAVAAQVLEHALQLAGHLLHTWRRHDFDANRHGLDIDFNFLVVEFSFAQHLAKLLPCVAILRCFVAGIEASAGRGRQEYVEYAFLCSIFGAMPYFAHGFLARNLDGDIHEIANDRINFAADIANFGEFGRFHLDERRLGQLGQPP